MDIGLKLRELRVLKGLTQGELANRAEFPKGFISQLERDLISPSTATLMNVLQYLGTIIGKFSDEVPEGQVVFDKADYFEKHDAEPKNEVRWTTPNAQKDMVRPIMLTSEAGGETYPDSLHGGEEFSYILQGSIPIYIGDKIYRIKRGESFYFISDKKYYLTSKIGATLLWVSLPPSL